jgi:UDP:flavonoid glycosyltransferase YjiC (YdhE family)
MEIAFVILGTRGDVQPMIALATGLMKKGHEAIICAPPEHEELARQNNLEMSLRLQKVDGLDLTVNLIEKEFST